MKADAPIITVVRIVVAHLAACALGERLRRVPLGRREAAWRALARVRVNAAGWIGRGALARLKGVG